MSNQHPIIPPPDLVEKWALLCSPYGFARDIARQAAQWGADQELEACCEWVSPFSHDDCYYEDKLRAARRPKPPSLKEQALARTDAILNDPSRALLVEVRETLELNRKALEALPND